MKWISIKKKLPESNNDIEYLTTDGKFFCLQTYYNNKWHCVHDSELGNPCEVKYWRLLPELPEKPE